MHTGCIDWNSGQVSHLRGLCTLHAAWYEIGLLTLSLWPLWFWSVYFFAGQSFHNCEDSYWVFRIMASLLLCTYPQQWIYVFLLMILSEIYSSYSIDWEITRLSLMANWKEWERKWSQPILRFWFSISQRDWKTFEIMRNLRINRLQIKVGSHMKELMWSCHNQSY
jgi:hypothetical protein